VPQASVVGSPASAYLCAAPPPFGCSWWIGGWDAAWVQVAGELDLATSPRFRETLGEAERAARLVVLDLRELSFIASSGVHVILDVAGDARRKGGRLLIVRGPAQVDRMLKLMEVCMQVLILDLDSPGLPHALSDRQPPAGGA
jgi:anti-sigma B factor antagonist